MNQDVRDLCKLISIFLQYPDDDLLKSLEPAREALRRLPPGEASQRCHEFLEYLEGTLPLRLREIYTETFDMGLAPLHLTFYACGESEERGRALCQWRQIYDSAGYDPVDGELPDYLPMVLELMSICPNEMKAAIWEGCREPMRRLSEKLRKIASPYAGILEGLAACIADPRSEQDRSEI